jgi:hypothetical protein
MPLIPNDPNALESRLRQSRPPSAVPPDLHDSILSAVRSPRATPPATAWPRRIVSLAMVALAAGALWFISRPSNHALPQMPVVAVMKETRRPAQEAPSFVLSPLTEEMDALSRDFTNATQLVRGTLPFDQSL